MPINIVTINNSVCKLPNAKDTIAGAGQKPTMPQPIPNKADPTIKNESISVRLGISKSKLSNVLFFFLARLNAKKLMNTADAITNNNDGSQFSPKVKKPIIFEGLVIWARINPTPKIIPTNKEMITLIPTPFA
ncbi:MAG: hypothetical protein RI951_479 [Pseudomonadota bacterium]